MKSSLAQSLNLEGYSHLFLDIIFLGSEVLFALPVRIVNCNCFCSSKEYYEIKIFLYIQNQEEIARFKVVKIYNTLKYRLVICNQAKNLGSLLWYSKLFIDFLMPNVESIYMNHTKFSEAFS